MNTSSLLLAVATVTLYFFLWIGAPILLVGWLRSRRQEAIQRQIALGIALIRLGHWIVGQSSPTPGTPIGLRQARS